VIADLGTSFSRFRARVADSILRIARLTSDSSSSSMAARYRRGRNSLDFIAQDRDEVHDRLLWAITDGYHRSNATPTGRRTAPDTTATTPEDADHVKPPRHDIGIGNHRARQTAQAALSRLRKTEALLYLAVLLDTRRNPSS
jgi:hypothetical protein